MAPHDGVYPNAKDRKSLAKGAHDAYLLGFGGKHAIHPDQIDVIRESFSPSDEQLSWARRVLDAFAESEAKGVAAIELDGRFIDYPVVRRAEQIVASGTGDERSSES